MTPSYVAIKFFTCILQVSYNLQQTMFSFIYLVCFSKLLNENSEILN